MATPLSQPVPRDGRNARSERSRRAVAEAMLDLLREGVVPPTTDQIAERAGVSRRAVFRLFEDRESLIASVANLQVARLFKRLPALITQGTLERRLRSVAQRVAIGHEYSTPVRRATRTLDSNSDEVKKRAAWEQEMTRTHLRQVFRAELQRRTPAARTELINALTAAVSWECWDQLRERQGLTVPQTRRAMMRTLRSLVIAPEAKK